MQNKKERLSCPTQPSLTQTERKKLSCSLPIRIINHHSLDTVRVDMTQWPEATRNHMLALKRVFQACARLRGDKPPVVFDGIEEMFLWSGYDQERVN
jgi:hypothetical protein